MKVFIRLWWKVQPLLWRLQHHLEKLFGWFPLRIVRKSTLDWYDDMAYRFSCVLDHTTGRMSKTNYTLNAMYAEIDDAFTKARDEAYQDGLKAGREPDDFEDHPWP